ncbi:MAG TPA: DUF2141 domain-containing protein [Cyclobacteriaceae bacterium]|jgi:uncharacterized protein (DUF2141 family)|nr:DUF2141 domain-containing protein [Cyclobacteriaceae bacterium]
MKLMLFLSAWMFFSLANAQTDSVVYRASSKETATEKKVIKKVESYSITITVTNIRNHKGVIRFKFFDDSTPFPHDTGFRKVVVNKSEITGDSFTVTYDGFISQYMGIALLDDENSNWKLDMGWFLPKEGHAFSDYHHIALRKPVYKDFRFLLTGNKKVVMKMKYY